MKLTIAYLYPSKMNIYGDRGNILALEQRLNWRGVDSAVKTIEIGDKFDFTQADIIFGGGGQDAGQLVIARDLQKRRANINSAVENGVSVLTICGSYQLFGHKFITKAGKIIPGIGVFDAHTVGSNQRMIGNIVIKTSWGRLVGFENHSGQTYLASSQPVLGRVSKGYGNNSRSKTEGAVYKNAYGTYLHGPILPKNPALADRIIHQALSRKYPTAKLNPLNDDLEWAAAKQAAGRSR